MLSVYLHFLSRKQLYNCKCTSVCLTVTKTVCLSESCLSNITCICHLSAMMHIAYQPSSHPPSPSASQNHNYQPSCLSPIIPISHYANQPSSDQSDFKTALKEYQHYSQLLSLLACLRAIHYSVKTFLSFFSIS